MLLHSVSEMDASRPPQYELLASFSHVLSIGRSTVCAWVARIGQYATKGDGGGLTRSVSRREPRYAPWVALAGLLCPVAALEVQLTVNQSLAMSGALDFAASAAGSDWATAWGASNAVVRVVRIAENGTHLNTWSVPPSSTKTYRTASLGCVGDTCHVQNVRTDLVGCAPEECDVQFAVDFNWLNLTTGSVWQRTGYSRQYPPDPGSRYAATAQSHCFYNETAAVCASTWAFQKGSWLEIAGRVSTDGVPGPNEQIATGSLSPRPLQVAHTSDRRVVIPYLANRGEWGVYVRVRGSDGVFGNEWAVASPVDSRAGPVIACDDSQPTCFLCFKQEDLDGLVSAQCGPLPLDGSSMVTTTPLGFPINWETDLLLNRQYDSVTCLTAFARNASSAEIWALWSDGSEEVAHVVAQNLPTTALVATASRPSQVFISWTDPSQGRLEWRVFATEVQDPNTLPLNTDTGTHLATTESVTSALNSTTGVKEIIDTSPAPSADDGVNLGLAIGLPFAFLCMVGLACGTRALWEPRYRRCRESNEPERQDVSSAGEPLPAASSTEYDRVTWTASDASVTTPDGHYHRQPLPEQGGYRRSPLPAYMSTGR